MTKRPRPGVDNPGILDGDVLCDLLEEMAPRRWTHEATRAFADRVLAEMHRVGFVILRGPNSRLWTPPAPDEDAHQAAIDAALEGAVQQFKGNWFAVSAHAYARAAVDHALRKRQSDEDEQ